MLACFSTSSLAGPVEDVNEAIRRRDQLLPAANSSIILVGRIVMALNRGVVRIAHLGNRPSRVERSCLAILNSPAARLRWYAHAPPLLPCRPPAPIPMPPSPTP